MRLHSVTTGYGYLGTDGSNIGFSTSDYWANGVGGGVTFTPIHAGPLSLGLDLRGSTSRQKQGADTILVGIKAGFKLPLISLKPYLQGSGGYVGTRSTTTLGPPIMLGGTVNRTFYAYELLGGLDFAILPHLDLRLIEIGGGQGYYHSSSSSSIPNINLLTVNTGVVVHF